MTILNIEYIKYQILEKTSVVEIGVKQNHNITIKMTVALAVPQGIFNFISTKCQINPVLNEINQESWSLSVYEIENDKKLSTYGVKK